LDFGCGGGLFLHRMHRQGWHVTGLDVSTVAVEKVRTELGLPALVGTLPHPRLKPESFDVITMWHSLEHVHNPREVLENAYSLLAPGGKLLVAAPNIDSLAFRWFRSAWFALELPRHLTHFTPDTLRRLLTQTGFRVNNVYAVREAGWIRYSARLAGQEPTPRFLHRCLRLRTLAKAAELYAWLLGRANCLLASATRDD
jgi:2-polyprenyl-3-methyl-5-hydroxy-6-metoxy-1,4-benzoquinol methylase